VDQTALEEMAGRYLWAWTGGVFGLCPLEVRPCLGACNAHSTFWDGGLSVWVNCGVCGKGSCTCKMLNSVALPGPVDSIESVAVDGVLLPTSAYVVYDNRFLVRVDGGEWPRCQDLGQPATAPDTWLVAYTRGIPVPQGGQIAAGILACELAKAAAGASSCQLPKRIQSITRQGITVTLLDPFEGLDDGRTGIWMIDSWVASATKPPKGGSVRSVDVSPGTRRVTWAGAAPWLR
jgi:hypothetical protein